MAGGKVMSGAIDAIKGWGHSIKSNLSVGGFQGLSKEILEKENTALKNAKTALKDIVEDDSEGIGKVAKSLKMDAGEGKNFTKKQITDSIDAYSGLVDESIAGGRTMGQHYAELGVEGIGGKLISGSKYAGQYYFGGTKAQSITRIGATVGAYAGVNTMIRGLSSAGVNSKGEKDIAGIPGL